jgi:citrate lyase subunit beta/citryl-CoA lyase
MKPSRMRSFFIAPGNRPDLVAKFPRFCADFSVIDLEDGTPLTEKDRARMAIGQLVADLRPQMTGLLGIRVNEPSSDWYMADIETAAFLPIDVLVVPKLEAADELFPMVHAIRRAERQEPRGRSIMAGIESVHGVAKAQRLFSAYPEVRCMYFGAEDFIADIGGHRSLDSAEVSFARSSVLLYAKQAALMAVDQAIADVRNDALFRQDAERGKQLGYDGKICLLPNQVQIAHEVFSPSVEEIAYAQQLLAAYAAATARGIGTIDFQGKMIDGPLVKRAQRTLARASLIPGPSE